MNTNELSLEEVKEAFDAAYKLIDEAMNKAAAEYVAIQETTEIPQQTREQVAKKVDALQQAKWALAFDADELVKTIAKLQQEAK